MASTSSSNNVKHESFESCFDSWMTQQQNDLEELVNALGTSADDKMLKQLTEKNIKQLEEFHDIRALLAQHDAPSFLSPSWCTSLENSFLWIGGYRPSLFIRFVYSVSGSELEAQLQNLYRGEREGNLGEISPRQLTLINSLHCKVVTEEDKLSTKMATLQENIEDGPLLTVAAGKLSSRSVEVGMVESRCEQDDEIVYQALHAHALSLAPILAEADKLRLNILKELLIEILTPSQAVDLLVASKRLHLSIHEWGKKRDQQHLGN